MQKILIVDDSEINREILAAMLEKTYEIDMAKDGQEAIEILEKKWETYQIVLLDLNMPVINGYEVLKVMEEKQWLDSLPVICISAETSEASIGKAYELGATDYFTRPFDTAVVLRRVHNTIALYAKASSSLHDAMEMLSGIFYRIIKINLSTDTYRTLKNISDDFRSPLDGIKSISQRLMQYGEEYVHEEDQEAFLEFCDSENLRKNFSEEDTERISMSYRCRNGQEFRWVSMEIIKSTEYAKDNEVVVLPGKQLLFMGQDFGQLHEWDEKVSLDWHLTEEDLHKDLQNYVRDLLHIYQKHPALYESDDDWDGFSWINANDGDRSIYSFVRYAKNHKKSLLFVCNFTPVARPDYRVGVPKRGNYTLILDNEHGAYKTGEKAPVFNAVKSECDGQPYSVALPLSAYGTAILRFS